MQKGIRILFYYSLKIGLLFAGDYYKSSSEKQPEEIAQAQEKIEKYLKEEFLRLYSPTIEKIFLKK